MIIKFLSISNEIEKLGDDLKIALKEKQLTIEGILKQELDETVREVLESELLLLSDLISDKTEFL